MRRLLGALVALALAWPCVAHAVASTDYTFVGFDTYHPVAINSAGYVLLNRLVGGARDSADLWHDGITQTIIGDDDVHGLNYRRVYDISDSGLIGGTAQAGAGGPLPSTWTTSAPGVGTALPAAADPLEYASWTNSRGDVIGFGGVPVSGGEYATQSYLFPGGGSPVPIGNGFGSLTSGSDSTLVCGLSESGQIVAAITRTATGVNGYYLLPSASATPAMSTQLDFTPASCATDGGQIYPITHPMSRNGTLVGGRVRRDPDGTETTIGTSDFDAISVNDSGAVVGCIGGCAGGALVADGAQTPLNPLLPGGWTKMIPREINNAGDIIGLCTATDNSLHGCLLERNASLTISTVSIAPDPPGTGDDPITVSITVRNDTADTVTGVSAGLTSNTPGVVTVSQAPAPASVDSLAPGASTTFTAKLHPVAGGDASLAATASATDGSSALTATPRTRTFTVAEPGVSIALASSPRGLQPGDEATVTATLVNHGAHAVTDLDPSLKGPDGVTIGGPSWDQQHTLGAGATDTVTWKVTAATAGKYALTGKVGWTDDSTGAQSSTSSLDLTVANAFVVNSDGDDDATSKAVTDRVCDVDDTADGDQCTLRAALTLADAVGASGAPQAIHFDIPGAGAPTIMPATELPVVKGTVTIDGTTQPGGWVHLSGAGATAGFPGLDLAGKSLARGLVIGGFAKNGGLVLEDAAAAAGDRIGTDVGGLAADPNLVGILLRGDNRIGGTDGTSAQACTGDCMLVAGNAVSEISNDLGDLPRDYNISDLSGSVQGSWIGVDATGTRQLGNAEYGIYILWPGKADGYEVGGSTSSPGVAPGNVIASAHVGVYFYEAAPHAAGTLRVQGNLVGLAPGGEATVGHGTTGVAIPRTTDANVIGGDSPSEGNVISGWATGVANDALIANDRIGTDVTGTKALPNTVGVRGSGAELRDNEVSGNHIGVAYRATLTSGNLIGLGPDGKTPVPNDIGLGGETSGVTPFDGNRSTLSAGYDRSGQPASCASPCNVISGNRVAGIQTDNGGSLHLAGTYIGTDRSGTVAVPNGVGIDEGGSEADDIKIGGATGLLDGKPCAYPCNVIAGNTGAGIHIDWAAPAQQPGSIAGNLIGVAAGGRPLPNGGPGVEVSGPQGEPLTIGGDRASADLIHTSAAPPVKIDGVNTNSPRVTVRTDGFDNQSADESIARPGFSPPIGIKVRSAGAKTVITGTVPGVNDLTGSGQTVEAYASPGCDPPGLQLPVGTVHASVLTSHFTLKLTTTALVGRPVIRLTRTTDAGDTSSMSGCLLEPGAVVTNGRAPAGSDTLLIGTAGGWKPGQYVEVPVLSFPRLRSLVTGLEAKAIVRRIRRVRHRKLTLAAPLPTAIAKGTVAQHVKPPHGDRRGPKLHVKRHGKKLTVTCSDGKGVGVEHCPQSVRVRRKVVLRAWDRNGNVTVRRLHYRG